VSRLLLEGKHIAAILMTLTHSLLMWSRSFTLLISVCRLVSWSFYTVLSCDFSVTTPPTSPLVPDYPLKNISSTWFVQETSAAGLLRVSCYFPVLHISFFFCKSCHLLGFYLLSMFLFCPFSSRQCFVSCVFAAFWFLRV
jgi:hypothetical protein